MSFVPCDKSVINTYDVTKRVMKCLRRKNRIPIEKLSITSDSHLIERGRGREGEGEGERKNIWKENSPYPLSLIWEISSKCL